MERMTYRDENGRAQMTLFGKQVYCLTQATADCVCKLEEALVALFAFKSYFDGLYGEGLDVANYHLNGATEPFDSFYDSAISEYENAKQIDTRLDYEADIDMAEYCERYESTYNPEDGSM